MGGGRRRSRLQALGGGHARPRLPSLLGAATGAFVCLPASPCCRRQAACPGWIACRPRCRAGTTPQPRDSWDLLEQVLQSTLKNKTWTCGLVTFLKAKETFVLVENNKSTSPGLVFQRGLRDLLQQVQQVPGCLVGSSRQWRYDVALGEHLCHGTYGSQRGLQTLLVRPTKPSEMLLRMTAVGFEPTPLRNGALSRRRA